MSSLFGIGGGGNVGASGLFYGTTIDQSLRFNAADSAHLTFTQGTATDISKWTVNFWLKRTEPLSASDDYDAVFGVDGPGTTGLAFLSGNLYLFINYNTGGSQARLITNRVFRDPSAWYNFHISFDRANSTDAHKVRLYINGVEETSFSTDERSNITSSSSSGWNVSGLTAAINRRSGGVGSRYHNGYLAQFHNIDGAVVAPTEFAETKNGVWVPKAYSGSYGNNGWLLEFKQTGTGTGASNTVGADTSGNDNHWDSSGVAASDVVNDSPTNNFATLNVLQAVGNATFSEGNLRLAGSGADYDRAFSTIGLTSGKWYAEFRYISGDNRGFFGVIREDSYTQVAGDYIGELANQYGLDFRARSYSNNVELFDTTDFSIGDIGLLCFDIDDGKIWFGRRDISGATTIWYDSTGANNGDPSAGTNPTYTGTFTGHTWFIGCSDFNTTTVHANFGADGSFSNGITSGGLSDANGNGDFNYIEDGFLALCSANLPEPTIGPNSDTTSDENFNTVLYTGDGTTSNAITGVGHQPDLVWIKRRNNANPHFLNDSVRGATKDLNSTSTDAEITNNQYGILKSFDSDGFTVSVGSTNGARANTSGGTFVAWNWKAGGTAVSNTDGSITTSVSTNADAGISIIKYTGNSTSGATIGHNLGVTPDHIIIKRYSTAEAWVNWHKGFTATQYLRLYQTTAVSTATNLLNSTLPSSSVITLGNGGFVNTSSEDYICYAFAEKEGFSKFGTYVGNGSADGTFVYTGFRPAFVLAKQTNAARDWIIKDDQRPTYNPANLSLYPNLSNSEGSGEEIDLLSNGFKIRTTNGKFNASSGNYIYLAFAEAPFKYSNAR